MNETHLLPTINFNDIHISINANIAGTYLRKKNRRGFLQRRWFYIRFSLSKNENYCLEYSHKPLENHSRQWYQLENASIISSNQKTFTLQTYKVDKTVTTIILEADSKYHKDQWIHTLQHVINVANLRKQYLLYLIQQPLASDPAHITSNNSSSKRDSKNTPSTIENYVDIATTADEKAQPSIINNISSSSTPYLNKRPQSKAYRGNTATTNSNNSTNNFKQVRTVQIKSENITDNK